MRVPRVVALVVAVLCLPAGTAVARDSIVKVTVPDRAAAQRVADLDLDLGVTSADGVEIVLHSALEEARLRSLGLPVEVLVPDVARADQSQRAIEARRQADPRTASPLPTGREAYRTLPEIETEIRALAVAHPDRLRLFSLSRRSVLGREILGLRVGREPGVDRGRPVFLVSGVHHAREWPTAEFALELVHELLQQDGRDPQITKLLDAVTLVVVPVVNPDGYDQSRSLKLESKRKNCRANGPGLSADCGDQSNSAAGVDPNRNYGAFWGGPGASDSALMENFRGEGAYSEPEIQGMRDLIASQHVTVAINIHTPDAKLLRAPSSSNEPVPADVAVYQKLAEELASEVGWPAGPWPEIYYEASGTAEQTSYYGLGTLAFTPETMPGFSGNDQFHPPYEHVPEQWLGTGVYPNSSVRRMLLRGMAAAGDPTLHSRIVGVAPAGETLTLRKRVLVHTSGFVPAPLDLKTTMTVPADGRFTWHVNPSRRPSQALSEHVPEVWTLECGTTAVPVDVSRGGTARVALDACGRPSRVTASCRRSRRGFAVTCRVVGADAAGRAARLRVSARSVAGGPRFPGEGTGRATAVLRFARPIPRGRAVVLTLRSATGAATVRLRTAGRPRTVVLG